MPNTDRMDLWCLRMLALSFFALLAWSCLDRATRASVGAMALFAGIVGCALVAGLYALSFARPGSCAGRDPHYSYLIRRDWMLTRRARRLLALFGAALACYGLQCRHAVITPQEGHSLALFSVATVLMALFWSEPEAAPTDVLVDDIREELAARGYYDDQGRLVGVALVGDKDPFCRN